MAVAFGPTARFPAGLLAVELAAGAKVVRVHHQDRGPVFFGPNLGIPPGNRFDAPAGEYRMLYAAERLEGAFVEAVLRRPAGRILRREYVEERVWSTLQLQRSVILAKVFDEGLQFHGVDASVSSADNYNAARGLALALHTDFPGIDGLAYRSRYNNGEICFAFFDRLLSSDVAFRALSRFVDHPARTDALMRLHGAVFDTSPTP